MIEIWVFTSPGCAQIAVIDIQTACLIDYTQWYPGSPDLLGNLYNGRVLKKLTAIGGSFIDIHHDLAGFLPDNAGGKLLQEGDYARVKVTRSAQAGKGVRLIHQNVDGYNEYETQKTVCLLKKGISPFEEIANRYAHASIYLKELSLLKIIPSYLHSRICLKNISSIDPILEQIETLSSNIIHLPLGMKASIINTPALVAIDIDSADQSKEKENKATAQVRNNRTILPVLLRQLILRNISGAILIDLAGIPSKKRKLLQNDFIELLKLDPLRPKFAGFSHLGFAEITRPRLRPSLDELAHSPHGLAIKILNALEKKINDNPSRYHWSPGTLCLSLKLYNALIKDTWAITHFEQRNSLKLSLSTDPSFSLEQWSYHHG
ncbi:ribonuclease E/G [Commensalibacter sp. Nvir]|uniref:ribonuclease E/G n=1 Tax=Commensalibacter sp. Nvir TaxID=3069817 RepID=UPI0030C8AB88